MQRKKAKFSAVICCILVLQMCFSGFSWGGRPAFAEPSAQAINIRFQSLDAMVPEEGFADYGEAYGTRNGLEYGWSKDNTGLTVAGSVYGSDNPDTFIRVTGEDLWEMKLDNGGYEVAVTVGDAVYSGNTAISVEHVTVSESVYLQAGQQYTYRQSIVVQDGRLTLEFGGSPDTAIALRSISITPQLQAAAAVSGHPRIIPPPEGRKTSGNKILLSGESTNLYNTPETIRVPGLGEEIGRYMEEQIKTIDEQIQTYSAQSMDCMNCDAAALQAKILQSSTKPLIVRAGYLNLDNSVTFGSPEQPVLLILEGINTNRQLSLTVYGSLIVKQGMNANTELTLKILRNGTQGEETGNLWVKGDLHLNQNSTVQVDNQFFSGNLIYNNGSLQVTAGRMLVRDSMHINTTVEMNVEQEMAIGQLVSNNQTANLNVAAGDLFVKGNVNVNNHLSVQTGGWFAMGGNLVANKKPLIQTGNGGDGQTLLKFAINGLKAEYYSGSQFDGSTLMKVDEQVKAETRPILPAAGFNDQDFSVRWTGQLETKFNEEYEVQLETRGPVKLWINDQLLIDKSAQPYYGIPSGKFLAEAGKRYDIRIEYSSGDGNPLAVLYWQSSSQFREQVPSAQLFPFGVPTVAATATASDISLKWEPVFQAGGYEVEVDGVIHAIGPEPKFVYAGLNSGTSHSYRVRANSADIIGEWSSLQSSWTQPGVPGNIRLESTSSSVTLAWDMVQGAAGYEIETYNTIKNVGSATQFTDTELNSNIQRTYRVRAYNSSGFGQWSPLVAAITLPGIPANLRGTSTDTALSIAWDPVSGAASYDLEADGALVADIHAMKYVHAPIEPSSAHTYRIRANNADGHSPWSEALIVYAKPSVPAHVRTEAAKTFITVYWDNASGAGGFEIEVDGAILPVGDALYYEHKGLAPNTEHSYRVRAVNEHIPGDWSPLKRAITNPDTPADVQAVTVNSSTINLTWDVVSGAVGYELEVDGTIIPLDLNNTFRHTNLQPNSTHTYRVRAWNSGGTGDWSPLVSKATGLGQPQNVSAQASEHALLLSWNAVYGAVRYEVMADGERIEIEGVTQYEHANLTPNSRHLYRVRAVNEWGAGDWSETISSLTTLGTPRITDVKSYSSSIHITWSEVTGAEAYELEADGTVLSVGMATSYIHDGLSSNTSHAYRVRAVSAESAGEWSNWSTPATSSTTPGVPRNVTAVATANSIQLSWDRVMGAGHFDVEVDGQTVKGASTNSFIHEGLDPNTIHTYRVRSSGAGGTSPWSEKFTKTTIPELTIHVGQDTQFNFIFVVPRKTGASERTVAVTFNQEELEVLDLSALTPEYELATGPIHDTNIIVTSYEPGRIVFKVYDTEQTMMNSIKFQAKTGEYSKISYVIE